jgi:hypothetical protein
MTPGRRTERVVVGYQFQRTYQWVRAGAVVVISDASFTVFDANTGNEVIKWDVASGHIVIDANNQAQLTVPADQTSGLAKRQLGYTVGMTETSETPTALCEGTLLVAPFLGS